MIELVERRIIFENYKIIASEIAKIQEAIFDNDIYLDIEDENKKIEYKNIFDGMDYKKYPIKYDIKILATGYNEIKIFSNKLYQLLLKLFEKFSITELFILLDLKINYYESLFNKYKRLVRVYKKLQKITIKKFYDEAFYLNRLSEEIVEIIFWLSRCSPQMNNIIIFDKMERYYLNICKYGNIHMTGLNGNIISEEVIKKIGLKIVEGKENDNFTDNGKINGRKIKI